MPRGGGPPGGGGRGRGKKHTHKGGNRQFTPAEEILRQQEDIKKEKERREREEEEGGGEEVDGATPGVDEPKRVVSFGKKTEEKEKEESEDDSDEEESEDDEDKKAKGVDHLIKVDNPNRKQVKMKKLKDLTLESTAEPELSRKEREAIEKERAKEAYQRLHKEGKTEEARADLARLAIIRKQREEAAKKREEDQKKKRSRHHCRQGTEIGPY